MGSSIVKKITLFPLLTGGVWVVTFTPAINISFPPVKETNDLAGLTPSSLKNGI